MVNREIFIDMQANMAWKENFATIICVEFKWSKKACFSNLELGLGQIFIGIDLWIGNKDKFWSIKESAKDLSLIEYKSWSK